MFPDKLKGLTPVKEKLIALNSCYRFITKHIIADGHRQSMQYPKHIKGHVTIFPNNVQELATRVLPHPLLTVMDEIHVSWQGREKPRLVNDSIQSIVTPRWSGSTAVHQVARWNRTIEAMDRVDWIESTISTMLSHLEQQEYRLP